MVLVSVNDESKQPDQQQDHRSKARWSASKKVDVVMRLLRGESLDEVSRDVGVEAHRLAAWQLIQRHGHLTPREAFNQHATPMAA